ncbi:acyl-CoA dehydrogenase family protein [Verrucomicrobium spinosum]|uniref:acyl-CoA dehydrogenase family protein n=1 Tax=Verrucomicrobium spinosum TaxID=2736 RepID=UPI00210A6145|nr:acyl-CoA dehydrogenase family protein [Verrucomicrobium spinosum]
MGKLWGSERGWEIVDDTMQIRGGRGYETADSLKSRGEKPEPIERFFRDARINTIFEGSSEIMRLFIAREMLDSHLKLGAAAFNTKLPLKDRALVFLRAARHYAKWYPTRFLPFSDDRDDINLHPDLEQSMRDVRRLSRKLARHTLYAMLRYGPKLEREQLVLGRLVDIGAEIFALGCAASYAQSKVEDAFSPRQRWIA